MSRARPWKVEVAGSPVDSGTSRANAMNQADWWKPRLRGRSLTVHHVKTRECWLWKGSTWVKISSRAA